MKLNRFTKSLALTALVVSFTTASRASLIDLGAAGSFAALALTHGIDDSGPQPPSNSASSYSIDGNVGVASAGQKFQASGSVSYSSKVYLHTGDTYNSSAKGVPQPQPQNAANDAFLTQARNDAFNASSMALSLGAHPTATYGTISTDFTIGEASKGNYVFNLQGINYSGNKTLTLDAPAGSCYVVNISDSFVLTGGSVLLKGGLTAGDVLLNYTGTNEVRFSGGGNSSIVYGTVLAPHATIGLHPGLIVGRAIGDTITMSSGAQIIGVTPVPEVTPGSMILGFAALVAAFATRKQWTARLVGRKAANHAA